MSAMKMQVAARSDVGRVRTNNEDAFVVVDLATTRQLRSNGEAEIEVQDSGVLLALCDGMGGHQAGEVASAMVLDSLCQAMRTESAASVRARIEVAVRRANQDVVMAARTQNKKGMGATLTAVMVHGLDATVAEIGDSRAYLLRGGRLTQLTRDQSLVQMLVDSGVLSVEEARTSPQKNVILQAMGLADDVRVALVRLPLCQSDTLLLCCDGLSNALSDDEIQALLSAEEPAGACEKLIALANERGGEDNLTAIVARLEGDALPSPLPDSSVRKTLQVLQTFTEAPAKKPSVTPASDRGRTPLPSTPSSARPARTEPGIGSTSRKMLVVIVLMALLVAVVLWWNR